MRFAITAAVLAGIALLAWRAEAGDAPSPDDRLGKIEEAVRALGNRLTALEATADPTHDDLVGLGPQPLDKPPAGAEKQVLMDLWIDSLSDALKSRASFDGKVAVAVAVSAGPREVLYDVEVDILKLHRALRTQVDELVYWRAKGVAAGLTPVKK